MTGLLNKFLGVGNALTPKQWAGIGGLSQGLLKYGAPTKGMPGPNAWGMGLSMMGESADAYEAKEQAKQMKAIQQQLAQAQAAHAQAQAKVLQQQAAQRQNIMGLLQPAAKTPSSVSQGLVPPSGAPAPVTPVTISSLPPVAGSVQAPGQQQATRVSPPMPPQIGPQAGPSTGPQAAPQAQTALQQQYPWLTNQDVQYLGQVLSGGTVADFNAAFSDLRKQYMDRTTLSRKDMIQLEDEARKSFIKNNEEDIERIKNWHGLQMLWRDESMDADFRQVQKKIVKNGAVGLRDANGDVLIPKSRLQLTGQGARDLALIFKVMKMYDPKSTVREGEFQMAAGVSGAAKTMFTRMMGLMTGDGLPPEARAALLETAMNEAQGADLRLNDAYANASGRMTARGLNANVGLMGARPEFQQMFDPAALAGGQVVFSASDIE